MRFDEPMPDNETRPWWDAAADGRLLIKHCNACALDYWYPRSFCPECWSEETEWCEASGRATLYTYSVVYRNDLPPWPDRIPYVAAVVDLREGPRMITQVVECDEQELAVGMELEATFRADEDGGFTLPVFRPAAT